MALPRVAGLQEYFPGRADQIIRVLPGSIRAHPPDLIPRLMKFSLRPLLPLLASAFAFTAIAPLATAAEKIPAPAFANEGERLRAALAAADDERLAATKAGDQARLEAILSNDLHYAHSSGKVDSKASLIKALTARTSVYESFHYQERKFTLIGAGLATMTGRVLVKVGPAGKPNELDLSILAIWREENGQWRFLAWQSCKMPVPAAAPTKN